MKPVTYLDFDKMNLTGVEAYVQKVVLGLVILIAVLFDTIRSKGWPDSLKFRVKAKDWGNWWR